LPKGGVTEPPVKGRSRIIPSKAVDFFVTTQESQKRKLFVKEKKHYFCVMEEMISINRSEYERFLSKAEKPKEPEILVLRLREKIELLKNVRNSKTSSAAPSPDILRSNTHSLRRIGGRKSGGQKAHSGHALSLSGTPDRSNISFAGKMNAVIRYFNAVFIIMCLQLQFSCGQPPNKIGVFEPVLFDSSVKIVKIENVDEDIVVKYSDIYDNVNFIKLETQDSSLIGRIDKIIAIDDKIIILDKTIAKMVFVFDYSGKFLNRIGSNGGGPEEYDSPNDIGYDKYNNEILVLCHNRKNIMRFHPDGTFIKNIKFDLYVSSIFVMSKNTYLLSLNNYSQKSGVNDYNILIVDDNGKILNRLSPHDETTGKLYSPGGIRFSNFQNEVLFSQHYSNKIFKINHDEIKAKYYMDLGRHTIPSTIFNNATNKDIDKAIRENEEYAFSIFATETLSHVISQFVYKRKIFDCYHFKKSGITKVSSLYFNDIYALSSNRSFITVKGDSIISFVEPQSFISYQGMIKKIEKNNSDIKYLLLDQFGSMLISIFGNKMKTNYAEAIKSSDITLSDKEIDFINGIGEFDNPIIMIAKLKK
jgi:hypothetical protein